MVKIFNLMLIITFIIVIFLCLDKYSKEQKVKTKENFNDIKLFNENIPETTEIKFDYNIKPLEERLLIEQNKGVNLNTISQVALNENNNEFIEAKENNNYLFDAFKSRNKNIDGKMNINNGKTLKEIYDNSFINFKQFAPNKKRLDNENNDLIKGASNLKYYGPDVWKYENEKPENGGVLYDGIVASDMYCNNLAGIIE